MEDHWCSQASLKNKNVNHADVPTNQKHWYFKTTSAIFPGPLIDLFCFLKTKSRLSRALPSWPIKSYKLFVFLLSCLVDCHCPSLFPVLMNVSLPVGDSRCLYCRSKMNALIWDSNILFFALTASFQILSCLMALSVLFISYLGEGPQIVSVRHSAELTV